MGVRFPPSAPVFPFAESRTSHLSRACLPFVILREQRDRRISRSETLLQIVHETYFVYIMSNRSKTIHVGVTGNLHKRVYEHKNKLVEGFTRKYNITKLVYFESTDDVYSAIAREKQIKGWLRRKKIKLIEHVSPEWKDLGEEL